MYADWYMIQVHPAKKKHVYDRICLKTLEFTPLKPGRFRTSHELRKNAREGRADHTDQIGQTHALKHRSKTVSLLCCKRKRLAVSAHVNLSYKCRLGFLSTAWYWLTYSEQQEDKAEHSSEQCIWVKKWRIEAQKHVTYVEIQVLHANKIGTVQTAMHVPSNTTWCAKARGMSEAMRNKATRLWISWRLNSWHFLAL